MVPSGLRDRTLAQNRCLSPLFQAVVFAHRPFGASRHELPVLRRDVIWGHKIVGSHVSLEATKNIDGPKSEPIALP